MGSHEQTHKEDIDSERAHFDKYYHDSHLTAQARGYRVDEAAWEQRATRPNSRPLDYWEYAFHLLGDLRGKRVLDFGCGGGWISRLLAMAGARVAAFDVSVEGCRLTREKLKAYGFPSGSIAVMDGHAIALRAASFDAVFISGVLHHMNIDKVAGELHRVLRKGGRVVCYEPLDYGPIMWALRQLWLRLHGLREYETTEHEEQLKEGDLVGFQRVFAKSHLRKFNFIAKTNRLRNRFGPLATTLRWIDYGLLSLFPFLRRFCTCIVCSFEK
jgi:SAM-dependent methyltransferase